jgi:hypothetical protein
MPRTRVEFFALPDEQSEWLRQHLPDNTIWCALWHPGKDQPLYPASFETVVKLGFRGAHRDDIMLFIGRRDIGAPVWRTTASSKREIDFIRSRAIQYAPSLVVGERILTSGQLAIMRSAYYHDAGVDDASLKKWFAQMTGSLRRLASSGATVVCHTRTGERVAYPNYLVSPGAVEWKKAGRLLKSSPEGPVQFDLEFAKPRP